MWPNKGETWEDILIWVFDWLLCPFPFSSTPSQFYFLLQRLKTLMGKGWKGRLQGYREGEKKEQIKYILWAISQFRILIVKTKVRFSLLKTQGFVCLSCLLFVWFCHLQGWIFENVAFCPLITQVLCPSTVAERSSVARLWVLQA